VFKAIRQGLWSLDALLLVTFYFALLMIVPMPKLWRRPS